MVKRKSVSLLFYHTSYVIKGRTRNIYPKIVLTYLLSLYVDILAEHGVRFVDILVCFLLG